ncbi:MAG: 2-dehydropantoate 2-reductase [Chloroflexi bacterium]|nr:2-dehydropantoate 2-reductase [Chloroflexota bacterium]
MKIAVMGTGGVGGYFGGLLARAGEDVTFIARGAHLDAIRHSGLKVVSDLSGEFVVKSPATPDTKSVGPVDLALYAVKMYSNDEAIAAVAPMVGPDTVVLTLQNGIDNPDRLADAFGKERVMVGMAAIQARIEGPGVVAQLGQLGRVVFGEMEQGITPRGQRLYETFKRAGWNVELSENAMGAVWRKFIYLTGCAEVNAVTQLTFGEMRTIPETRALIRNAWKEIVAVAKARGASVGEDIFAWCEGALDGFPAGGMTSLANDFRNGNRVELEGLTGAVVSMGRQVGVPTPIHDTIYALLKPAAMKIEKARARG